MTRKQPPAKPSLVTDDYWIYSERKMGDYPVATERSGKWLVFVPLPNIDAVWECVRLATEAGKLGDSAKTATVMPNPNAVDQTKKVICVYTYDWQDKEDVMRIREELRKIGITWKIPYKTDVDTDAGKYRVTGHTRISKYYE